MKILKKIVPKKGIVYLIQPAELVGDTSTFKIGCSEKMNLERFDNYKNGTRYLCIMECVNPYEIEKKIKFVFNKKFKLKAGREFFQGDELEMIKEFVSLVFNHKQLNKEKQYNNQEDNLELNVEQTQEQNKEQTQEQNKEQTQEQNKEQTQEQNKEQTQELNVEQTQELNVEQTQELNKNIEKEKEPNKKSKDTYICEQCNAEFQTNSGLWKHKIKHQKQVKEKNEKKIYKCRTCPKQYNSKQSRWSHEQKCGIIKNKNDVSDQLIKMQKEIDNLKKKKDDSVLFDKKSLTKNVFMQIQNINYEAYYDYKTDSDKEIIL
jgi:DNA-directed RNA polymerase subunit RPC12/RpoP